MKPIYEVRASDGRTMAGPLVSRVEAGLVLAVQRRIDPAAEVAQVCAQSCGTILNPVAAQVGPVCGKCCRANHQEVAR